MCSTRLSNIVEMNKRFDELVICGFILTTLLLIHYFSDITKLILGGYYTTENVSVLIQSQSKHYSWLLKLLLNCFGYSCILLPGYFIIKYVRLKNYLEKNDGTSYLYRLVSLCINGSHGSGSGNGPDLENIDLLPRKTNKEDENSLRKDVSADFTTVLKKHITSQECLKLTWCFSGLMMSYLTWGVLQEKIMTQRYYNYGNGQYSHFTNSQYLVFANRLLAFLMSLLALQYQRVTIGRHQAPLYKYSYASLSNILSAWFQYEALKYVNFPTQVLAKSCKIIPVMLMGRLVSRTRYECYEYFTALLISLGMVLFMIGSADTNSTSHINSETLTATGFLLLAMYMLFDSFTANWQDSLFREYRVTPLQMMCGVNLFSTLFTAASLNLQGGFMESFQFIIDHPKFIFDILILSISSAIGQLFIFYTISVFGPVVFTIIMTFRQAFAILLSCLIYKHKISLLGILGIANVFVAMFLRVFCNQHHKAKRLKMDAHRPKQTV